MDMKILIEKIEINRDEIRYGGGNYSQFIFKSLDITARVTNKECCTFRGVFNFTNNKEIQNIVNEEGYQKLVEKALMEFTIK